MVLSIPDEDPTTEAPALSVVIPAWNEENRLPHTLQRLEKWIQRSGISTQIIIADDGSTDHTAKRAKEHSAKLDIEVISMGKHVGVATSLRAAVEASRGQRILICDADGPVPFEDIHKLWDAMDEGASIAAGSRRLSRSKIEERQPLHRVFIGKVWGRLTRTLVPTGVHDTQCGFKLFDNQQAKEIFTQTQSKNFTFHVEFLSLAKRQKLTITEVAVRWSDDKDSKIRLGRDSMAMLVELLKLRLRG
ncbi:glycosyltransferase [Myxococcota bacterium]|nr:glycosyltransferase [Myxococcota bacterium]